MKFSRMLAVAQDPVSRCPPCTYATVCRGCTRIPPEGSPNTHRTPPPYHSILFSCLSHTKVPSAPTTVTTIRNPLPSPHLPYPKHTRTKANTSQKGQRKPTPENLVTPCPPTTYASLAKLALLAPPTLPSFLPVSCLLFFFFFFFFYYR